MDQVINAQEVDTGRIAFAIMQLSVTGYRERLAHMNEVFKSRSNLPVSAKNELKDDVTDTLSMRRHWW